MPNQGKTWLATLLSLAAIVVAIGQFGGQFFVPEVRAWLGLHESAPPSAPQTSGPQEPKASLAQPQRKVNEATPAPETLQGTAQPTSAPVQPAAQEQTRPAEEIVCQTTGGTASCWAKAGFGFEYPAEQLRRVETAAPNELIRLRSDAGAVVTVTVLPDIGQDGLRRAYDQEIAMPNRRIKLQVIRGDSFVISGWDGSMIFYHRAIAIQNGVAVMRMSHESSVNPGIDLVRKVAQTLRARPQN